MRQNPHSPRKCWVKCSDCGHTWESSSSIPQCSNPDETEVDCGRGRNWEYLNEEDDPTNPKYNEDKWTTEPMYDEPTEEPDEEPEDEQSDEQEPEEEEELIEEKPEKETEKETEMVTSKEYQQFHSDTPQITEEESDSEPERDSGFSFPIPGNLAVWAGVAFVLVIVAYLYMSRKSGDEQPDEQVVNEVLNEEPKEKENEEPEPAPEPPKVEDEHFFDKKDRSEVTLFED